MNSVERKILDKYPKASFFAAYKNWGHTDEEAEKAWGKLFEEKLKS
jgi:hypothetical protein